MKSIKDYIGDTWRRFVFSLSRSLGRLSVLDWACRIAAAAALAMVILSPAPFGGFSEGFLYNSPRLYSELLRGIVVATGFLVLLDKRPKRAITKIGITLALIGLAARMSEAAAPLPESLRFSGFMIDTSLLVWFISVLFRPVREKISEETEI